MPSKVKESPSLASAIDECSNPDGSMTVIEPLPITSKTLFGPINAAVSSQIPKPDAKGL